MSASTNADPDLAAFRKDLVALKRDVASLRVARSFRQEAGPEGERSAKAISLFIEMQPFVALIIALGIGYIGARALLR